MHIDGFPLIRRSNLVLFRLTGKPRGNIDKRENACCSGGGAGVTRLAENIHIVLKG